MKYLVVGDSHTNIFTGENIISPLYPDCYFKDNFKIYRLGAPIAYNLIKYNTMYQAREKLETLLEKEVFDIIILVFGEIDCRYHIINQSRKQKKEPFGIICNCVDRYVQGIFDIFSKYPGMKIVIYGPPPSTWVEEKFSNNDMPIKGCQLERNQVTLKFNSYLRTCVRYNQSFLNINFITLFYKLIDNNLMTKPYYYMDNIHLNKNYFPLLLEELENLKWK